jgi:hypothetical protein
MSMTRDWLSHTREGQLAMARDWKIVMAAGAAALTAAKLYDRVF